MNSVPRWTRFIPTCVGNTAVQAPAAAPQSVHPHVRGEYACLGRERRAEVGSSPRAWGIRRLTGLLVLSVRFIPTCVGNTLLCPLARTLPPVHPHVRGEYGAPRFHNGGGYGSSPRAWGIHCRMQLFYKCLRFIPTCVGNTLPDLALYPAASVHPHVRGEYRFCWGLLPRRCGSSPRAWGIQRSVFLELLPCRFIPTCVGNTCTT